MLAYDLRKKFEIKKTIAGLEKLLNVLRRFFRLWTSVKNTYKDLKFRYNTLCTVF